MMLIIIMTASSLAILALFLYFRWAEVSRSYVQSRPWAVLCWCTLAAIRAVIPSTWLQEQMPDLPDTLSETMIRIMHVPGCFFVIAVLAPLTEEIVFRGAVLRALLRWSFFGGNGNGNGHPIQDKGARFGLLSVPQWGAVAVSALGFALVHGNPAQMPHAFLMGLLLGWLFVRTGSVLPGTVLHVVNNTVAFLMAAAYPSSDIRLIDILGGDERHVLMALGFSLMLLLPAIYQLHLNLRKADTL
jgi:membrane protease YdiL (CAAX protease family)